MPRLKEHSVSISTLVQFPKALSIGLRLGVTIPHSRRGTWPTSRAKEQNWGTSHLESKGELQPGGGARL